MSVEAPARPPRPPGPPRTPGPPDHRTATYYRLPRRRRRWPWVALWAAWAAIGVVVAVIVSGLVLLDTTLQSASPNTPAFRAAVKAADPVLPGAPVNVLLIGSDRRPGKQGRGDNGRSDSIILVRMDKRQGFISMLSFPRDLDVHIPGAGTGKINSAYSIGGPALTIRTIKALTGQRINYFFNVDFEGFVRLVDQVGGVYVDVDRRYFNDNSHPGPGGTYATIDLKPGYQRLDGNDALDYVRYRHTDSDFARIARQQQFLSELKRQTGRFGSIFSITSFARIFSDDVQTNLRSVSRLLSLLGLALTADKDRIAHLSVAGLETMRNGQSVILASSAEIRAKVREWVHPGFLTPRPGAGAARPSARASVLVLNGAGRVGAAEQLAGLLRGRGWRANAGGDAGRLSYGRSAVFYAPGRRAPALSLRALLGSRASVAPLGARDAAGHALIAVAGRSFRGRLAHARRAAARSFSPDVVWTDALVPVLARVQRQTGMRLTVPLRVPTGSRLRIVRVYRINTGGTGPWAVKLVFETGYHHYWGLEETQMGNPPILDGETGIIRRDGVDYRTYYDGKNLMRLAWQRGDMTYWLSNSLDDALSPDTMHAVARSARPVGAARLPRGATGAPMSVAENDPTP